MVSPIQCVDDDIVTYEMPKHFIDKLQKLYALIQSTHLTSYIVETYYTRLNAEFLSQSNII